MADVYLAQERATTGDVDGAVELAGMALDTLYESGRSIWCALATRVLVEALVQRNRDGDLHHAQTAMNRLAEVPTDPGFVLHDITLLRLRALLARVRGDESGYRGWVGEIIAGWQTTSGSKVIWPWPPLCDQRASTEMGW